MGVQSLHAAPIITEQNEKVVGQADEWLTHSFAWQ